MDSIVSESLQTDCVKVAVRVRPLIARERGCSEISILCDTKANEVIVDGNDDKRFTFNYVFDPNSKQEEIYSACVTPLLDSAFEGYNATILAYGQTGSGKTYTMGTAGRVANSSDVGIVPRVIDDIFQRKSIIEKEHPGSEIVIHVSFLEIYAENVRDLLEMDQFGNKEVFIRSDDQGGVKVIGQKTKQVTSAEELQDVLDSGSLYRATGHTSMNAFSSRSHAIFTIYIDQEIPLPEESNQEDGEKHPDIRQSKFHFVDLAGSERVSRTNSEGQRRQEGIDINRGLLALGKVIRALGDEKNKGTYPPYRDSKLTRLLMDSLGGNAKTLMITCVSPASDSLSESLGSLRYANSAKNIQNKPKVNKDKDSSLILAVKLRKENQQLRELLASKGIVDPQLVSSLAYQRVKQKEEERCIERDEEEKEKLEERVRETEETVKRLSETIHSLEQQLEEEKKKNSLLDAQLDFRIHKGELSDKELSEEDQKEISLLAEHKRKIKDLESQLQHKDEQIMELIHISEDQNQRNVADKMQIIDLQYRTRTEMEYEAANRLREALLNDKAEKEETSDDLGMNEAIADVEKEMTNKQTLLSQKVDVLVGGIRLRENELLQMKQQQAEYEALTGKYEEDLRTMTVKINQMEAEKNKLKQEMEQLVMQQKLHPAGGKDVSMKQSLLENKLKSKTDEITRIRSQKRELEKTVESLKSTSQRINRLTKEIDEMKTKKVSLQRSIETIQKQHKQEIEEKRREIMFLEKQKREQTRTINELQQSSRKADSLLRTKLDENMQLQKQLKDLKLSVDVQRREHERYSKEDQKRVRWLERQLQQEKRKDLVINQLEKKIEQKNMALQRYKDMLKEREMKQRKKRTSPKYPDADSYDRYEQEDFEDAIEQVRTELSADISGVEDLELLLRDNNFSEEKVMKTFSEMKGEDATSMLCVLYRRLVDYQKELNELSVMLGTKEDMISELNQEIKKLKRKLHIQKSQYEGTIKSIREEYEAKIFELQRQRDQTDLQADTSDRGFARAYYNLKQSYLILRNDYNTVKDQRCSYRSKYLALKEEIEKDSLSNDSGERRILLDGDMNTVSHDKNFLRLVNTMKKKQNLEQISR